MSDEQRIREALRDAPVPDEAAAHERGLRVVSAALEQQPASRRRAPSIRRLGITLAAIGLLSGVVLSPVGAEVRDWVGDVVANNSAVSAPTLTDLPGGGELLVESEDGPWVVRGDGSQRLLGDYEQATWSPRGLFIAVTDGGRLSAVDPMGEPRWTVSQPTPVRDPRWSPSGFRVAYRAGPALRVVAGDGTEDQLIAANVSPVAPVWRPGAAHVLAYVTPDGRMHALDTDLDKVRFLTGPIGSSTISLSWSADGRRVFALSPEQLIIFDGQGNRVTSVARPASARFVAAQWEPHGQRLALLWRYGHLRPRTELVIARPGPSQRLLFAAPGTLTDLIWSPGGERLLVSWQQADQWVFVPVDGSPEPQAVADISAQFAPGEPTPALPAISGWIQPQR